MPTNEVLRNAIRKAQPMKRAATFNVSAIGKRSVAYEGRPKVYVAKRVDPKTGKTEERYGTRPFKSRFTMEGIDTPKPIKKR
jgi:hypothetical protein